MADTVRYFDLNIEKVLEGWEVRHAIRELIANAIDERTLTNTLPVEIDRIANGRWRIRDHGRGLHHSHLTQNESVEKAEREREVIGRFGVGLKDALAVLDRRGVGVELRSRHGCISLAHRPKAGFADIETIHAAVQPALDSGVSGTEVILQNIADSDITEAQAFFLAFSGETLLETTRIGQVLSRRPGKPARIYVKGLVVAEEENFAFSYNITVLTKPMLKALNRERTNVGRTAYSDRVKSMLLVAESPTVAEVLVDDLARLSEGTAHDEVQSWADVGLRACQILNAARPVVFITSEQALRDKDMIDLAIGEGRDVITIPATVAGKLAATADVEGNPLQSLEQFASEWSESFEFKFIEERDLTASERAIFSKWGEIALLDGGVPREVKAVLVSATMRPSVTEGMNPAGVWEPDTGRVIISREQLRSLSSFAGTLLHEFAHARSGESDVTREFELALTETIGRVSTAKVGK